MNWILKNGSTRNNKEKEKKKENNEFQQYSIERDSSYDQTIKALENNNFGIFIKSHTDFIQQMVLVIKVTIPKVNNSEQIRAFFKVLHNSFSKNVLLDLYIVLSNFPVVEDFYLYIDIIPKLALVMETKVDWEKLFGE